jgi:hypothetical protein
MKILNALILILFALLLTCCKTKGTTNDKLKNLEKDMPITMAISQDSIVTNSTIDTQSKRKAFVAKTDTSFSAKHFRKWLKDTLTILRSKTIDTSKVKFSIHPDSVLIDIHHFYDVKISNPTSYPSKDDAVNYAIALLEEYNEMPKVGFRLIVESNMTYEKNPNDSTKIDFQYELSKIDVYYGNKRYRYPYIRGRLSEVNIYSIDENGVEKCIESHSFNYDKDNKLVKKIWK